MNLVKDLESRRGVQFVYCEGRTGPNGGGQRTSVGTTVDRTTLRKVYYQVALVYCHGLGGEGDIDYRCEMWKGAMRRCWSDYTVEWEQGDVLLDSRWQSLRGWPRRAWCLLFTLYTLLVTAEMVQSSKGKERLRACLGVLEDRLLNMVNGKKDSVLLMARNVDVQIWKPESDPGFWGWGLRHPGDGIVHVRCGKDGRTKARVRVREGAYVEK